MIKEFSIGFSRTINLGNFESCRVEANVTVAVDGPLVDDAIQRAQAELRALLEETYRAQFRPREASKPKEFIREQVSGS